MIRLQDPIQVLPLRRYARPSYPRAGEPIELALNDARTWPFPSTVAAVMLAASGAVGCELQPPGTPVWSGADDPAQVMTEGGEALVRPPSGVTPTPPPSSEPPDSSEAVGPAPTVAPHLGLAEPLTNLAPVLWDSAPEAPPYNPFTFEESALPPQNIWGKGTPGILPEEVAVGAIHQVFAARGISLASDVTYATDGVTASLDGLAAHSGVGFEFLSTKLPGSLQEELMVEDYQPPDDWVEDPESGEWSPVVTSDDPETLSEPELRTLDEDMHAGERHIAAINSADPRFVYNSDLVDVEASQEQALEQLVEAVHQYIDFLVHEGVL